jgi:hypothetical protein
MWTVFIVFIKIAGVLTEAFLALFTRKRQVCMLLQGVVFGFAMAVGTVEPFLACRKVSRQ